MVRLSKYFSDFLVLNHTHAAISVRSCSGVVYNVSTCPSISFLSGDRRLVHNGKKFVLSLDDGLLLLVRLCQIDY